MSDTANDLGTLARASGQLKGTLTRDWSHNQETVWNMLTDAARFPQWLAPGTIELKQGGALKLKFPGSNTIIDSTLSAFDAPRLIEYSFSGPGEPRRPVRWELQSQRTGVRITLNVTVPDNEDIARTCAGWEAHLAMLAAALDGAPIPFPFERFKAAREAYKAKAASV